MLPIRTLLAFYTRHEHTPPAQRAEACRRELGLSEPRYWQMLGRALDTVEAVRVDPVLVHRLRRMRDERAMRRAG